MSEEGTGRPATPKITGPLWVISLFLGLSEVTVTVATTQATGWIQGMLAIFAVAFPTLVTTVFFLILWHNNKILYAPGEFGEGTTVSEYAAAMSRSTRRSVNIVESALTKSLSEIEEKLDVLGVNAIQREEIFTSVTMAARRTVVRVDATRLKNIPTVLEIPVDDQSTVTELLDSVYFAIDDVVANFSYNKTWSLRDEDTGRIYSDIGRLWARDHLGTGRDFRLLKDVGVAGGSRLPAFPL